MPWRLLLAILAGVAAFVPPPLIGNEIIGEPQIVCESQHITFTAKTKTEFGGNAYTKGFFQTPSCHLRGNFNSSMINFHIPTSDACGVRRKRMAGRKGLELEVTVVLMFHPMFLTKGDRAFNVRCIYSEMETKVTRMLEVSTLAPTDLTPSDIIANDQQQPMCQYDVLMGGPTGKHVRFATIGDTVYHRWKCMTSRDEQYCMTVHSCSADDGQGSSQELVDADGCTVDAFLLPNLEILDGLAVGQETQVFKFADRPTVYFSCMIRLLPKTDGEMCPKPDDYCGMRDDDDDADFPTPKDFKPNENRRKLLRRSRQAKKNFLEVDVSAPAIDVFDVSAQHNQNPPEQPPVSEDICISKTTVAVLAALFICSSVVLAVSACILKRRMVRREKPMLFPPPY